MPHRSPTLNIEPLNAEAESEQTSDPGVEESYAAWVARLSAEQRAWEELLQDRLGSTFGGYYLPIYKKDRVNGIPTAWDWVDDDPRLPRGLLIGDSISRGYTLPVRNHLAGRANIHRAPENCGSTLSGIQNLDLWLGSGQWDVIHFNFGLHDSQTPIPKYERRLREIITRLKATGAKLIWATTTPRPVHSPEDAELASSDVRLRVAAARIIEENDIAVNDLFSAVLPHCDKFQKARDVHFNDEGYEFLGKLVAGAIERVLDMPPEENERGGLKS
jgi:hypothetical protein